MGGGLSWGPNKNLMKIFVGNISVGGIPLSPALARDVAWDNRQVWNPVWSSKTVLAFASFM